MIGHSARIGISALIACVCAVAALAAEDLPKPSENAGRIGTYQCATSHSGCNYYVCTPSGYSDEHPAGLYLFFHGQGGQGGAPHFHQAKKYFIEKHNLVAINMQYMDGDNSNDTTGKVEAAVEAVKQTMADYKIVEGRGVIASFSGGGLPHGVIFTKFQQGKRGADGIAWPFSHSQLTGSNFWKSVSGSAPMSWYIGVGGGEWTMGQPGLGSSSVKRASELYSMIAKGNYCADTYLLIIKEKGHSIDDRDFAASAELFARSDVLLAPFVYEEAYRATKLAAVADAANQRSYRVVLSRLKSLIDRTSTPPDLKASAEGLDEQVRRRIALSVQTVQTILNEDPICGVFYAKQLAAQLSGMPEAREVQKALSAVAKDRKKLAIYSLLSPFGKGIGNFFDGAAKLDKAAVPLLEQIRDAADEKVLIGRMAREFLALEAN